MVMEIVLTVEKKDHGEEMVDGQGKHGEVILVGQEETGEVKAVG